MVCQCVYERNLSLNECVNLTSCPIRLLLIAFFDGCKPVFFDGNFAVCQSRKCIRFVAKSSRKLRFCNHLCLAFLFTSCITLEKTVMKEKTTFVIILLLKQWRNYDFPSDKPN